MNQENNMNIGNNGIPNNQPLNSSNNEEHINNINQQQINPTTQQFQSNINNQNFQQSIDQYQQVNSNVYQPPINNNYQNMDEELRKIYIGKNADKIINGHGGSAWLFLFGSTYLLYRKLYLYGFIYLFITLLLSFLNLVYISFVGQIVLCFFFYKLYLKHVDKKVNEIKLKNPNASFEELKQKCKKTGGVSYGMVALSIALSLIVGFISVSTKSNKLICNSDEGDITIMYNDDELTGYYANGIDFDLSEQKDVAEEKGIEKYISEFNEWFISNTTGSCSINGKKVEKKSTTEETATNNTDTTDTKVVGADNYGYITLPSNWVKFYDVDGNDSLQYSYGNVYIISLNYLDNTYTAKEYASNYMYNKQNSSDVTGVTGATVKIGKNKEYTAYQVYMYYPSDSTYLVTYWFEAEDNNVHYIALEGPKELDGVEITDYLYIAESFSLEK